MILHREITRVRAQRKLFPTNTLKRTLVMFYHCCRRRLKTQNDGTPLPNKSRSPSARKQHRFLCMDRKVPQVKAVSEAKTLEELRDLPKIFEFVVNRDRQLGFELTQDALAPLQRFQLSSLDIHLDKVDAWEVATGYQVVDFQRPNFARFWI
jgi:hypothetical protein